MEGISVEYFPSSIDPGNDEEKYGFHSYIYGDNEKYVCDLYANMVHLLNTYLESGILVSSMSTFWEDTNACANQYRCALDIYSTTVLSSSYGIIMDREINAPGHGNNVADGINATDKIYLKEEMEIIGKLRSNDTTNIAMLPSASKDVSAKLEDQCLHILNNK